MKKTALIGFYLLFASSLLGQTVRDHRGSWQLLPGSPAKDVTINNDGIIYMVGTNGKLYKYSGSDWEEYDNSNLLTYAESEEGVGIKVLKNGLMAEKGGNGYVVRWIPIPGSDAQDIAISYIRSTVKNPCVIVNTAGKIYLREYTTTEYSNKFGWTQLPGSDGARVAATNNEIWLVNTVGKIYRFIPGKYRNHEWDSKWEQMPGSNGRDIAAAHDGTKWLVTTDGKVFKSYDTGWAEQTGISNANRIAANKGKVVVINTAGKMYLMTY